jgi:hypothetical protein
MTENAYKLPDTLDRLDPLSLLREALSSEMKRQLAVASNEWVNLAASELTVAMYGAARQARNGRGWLVCTGPAGSVLPADTIFTSLDRTVTAQLSRRKPLILGELLSAEGVTPDGRLGDLSARLLQERAAPTSLDADSLVAIQLGFRCSYSADDVAFPGFAWDVPSAVGVRVRAVRTDHEKLLRWGLDADGRLLVEAQRVSSWKPGAPGVFRVKIEVGVDAGNVRHLGRMWSNAIAIRMAGTSGAKAGALTLGRCGPSGLIQTAQPFACQPGYPAEGVEQWEERTSASLRHGGEIVNATDVADWMRLVAPGFRVLSVAAARVKRAGEYRDAMRVTIVPREWDSSLSLLRVSIPAARWIEATARGRTGTGVELVVCPPTLRVANFPGPVEDLWPYQAWLTTASEPVVFRHGTFWPVHTEAELRGGAP